MNNHCTDTSEVYKKRIQTTNQHQNVLSFTLIPGPLVPYSLFKPATAKLPVPPWTPLVLSPQTPLLPGCDPCFPISSPLALWTPTSPTRTPTTLLSYPSCTTPSCTQTHRMFHIPHTRFWPYHTDPALFVIINTCQPFYLQP